MKAAALIPCICIERVAPCSKLDKAKLVLSCHRVNLSLLHTSLLEFLKEWNSIIAICYLLSSYENPSNHITVCHRRM